MTDTEKANGHECADISNCDIGFMIKIVMLANCRARIECPIDGYAIRGKAEADYVRSAVAAWSKR